MDHKTVESVMVEYLVAQGDNLTSIADLFGCTKEEIYHHPLNEELRTGQNSAELVHAGDVIWVPADDSLPATEYIELSLSLDQDDDDEVISTVAPELLHEGTRLIKYKVRTGDQLKTLAEACGCTWKQLAQLNWATEDPDEVNWYLGNDFVCKNKVGYNYVFSDDDEPGILLLPDQFELDSFRSTRIVRAARFPVEFS